MPPKISTQRGIALLAFTVVLSIVTFTIVVGYSVSSARKQVTALASNQKAYLAEVRSKLAATYAANSLTIDADLSWSAVTSGEQVLALAGVSPRWGIQAAISRPISREGVKYRVMAAWLPLESVTPDDPVLGADGVFNPCPANTLDCLSSRAYITMGDGFVIQRESTKKAMAQLNQLALNSQSFFKAKLLLDPEHNVSVNYFRPPFGGCNAVVEQMPCVDSVQAIFEAAGPVQQRNSAQSMTELLGLPQAPVLNPWGLPIEVCNGPNCNEATPTLVKWDMLNDGPPYSMLFQSRTPWGNTYRVYAIQQI